MRHFLLLKLFFCELFRALLLFTLSTITSPLPKAFGSPSVF